MKKRINKILWYGDALENGKAKEPQIATSQDGLDGLNEGEIYISNHENDPALFIRTSSGKVARIGSVDIEELKEIFLNKTTDDTARGVITFEKGIRFGNLLLALEGNDTLFLKNILTGEQANFAASGAIATKGIGASSGGGGVVPWSEIENSIIPKVTDTYSIGTNTNKFKSIYAIEGHINSLVAHALSAESIKLNGKDIATKEYVIAMVAQGGGGGGTGGSSTVSYLPTIEEGKEIGTLIVDGVSYGLFAPSRYSWDEIDDTPNFATVAFSGSYKDLADVPTFYTLTIQKNGTEVGTFTPNSKDATINIDGVVTLSDEQTIAGRKTFKGGVRLDSNAVIRNAQLIGTNANDVVLWKIDNTGNATFVNGVLGGTLSVTKESTFTGKTTHNGGIAATSGAFSELLSANGGIVIPSGKTLKIGGTVIEEKDGDLFVNGNLAASGSIATKGVGSSSGGGGNSYGRLDDWTKYDASKGDVLSALLGYGLKSDIATLTSKFGNYFTKVETRNEIESYLCDFNDEMIVPIYSTKNEVSSLADVVGGIGSRVSTLEGKATAVSFAQTLQSGKQIGVISIDGKNTTMFAPASYAWGEITSRPTKLSDFTDDVVSGKYLPLSGGTMVSGAGIYNPNDGTSYGAIGFNQDHNAFGSLTFPTILRSSVDVILNKGGVASTILHTGNYSDYALPLSGDVAMKSGIKFRYIHESADHLGSYLSVSTDTLTDTSLATQARPYGSILNVGGGYMEDYRFQFASYAGGGNSLYYRGYNGNTKTWDNWVSIIHSGNYTDYTYSKTQVDTKLGGYQPLATAINTGNIGSQSVESANRLRCIMNIPSSGFDANTSLVGGGYIPNYSLTSRWGSTMPSGMSYGVVYQLQGYVTGENLAGQLAWDVNHNGADSTNRIWWRANDDTGFVNAKWHQIAFTDSKVASADYATSADTANILNKVYSENINYDSRSSHVKLIAYNSKWQDNGFPNNWTSGLSVQAGYVGWQMLVYGGNTDTLYFRKNNDDNTWMDWRIIAFTDSNVASATKLATARTIWGQNFDGTGDVRSDLFLCPTTDNGNNLSASLVFSGYSGFYYGPIIRTAAPPMGGGYGYGRKDLVFMQHTQAAWPIDDSAHEEVMRLTASGNVLIGTTTDNAYKLDVNGNGRYYCSTRYALEISSSASSAIISFGGTGGYEKGHVGINTNMTYMFNYESYRNNPNGVSGLAVLNSGYFIVTRQGAVQLSDSFFGINPSGNVTIGSGDLAGTTAKLYVDGSVYIGNKSDSMIVMNRGHYNRFIAVKENGFFSWRVNGDSNEAMVLYNNGYLGLNTLVPTERLHVEGNTYVNGSIKSTDDVTVGGTLKIGSILIEDKDGDLFINGNLAASGSVATKGIGTSSSGGSVTIPWSALENSLIAASTSYNLGSSAKPWGSVYANSGVLGTLVSSQSGVTLTSYVMGQGNTWQISANGSASFASLTVGGANVNNSISSLNNSITALQQSTFTGQANTNYYRLTWFTSSGGNRNVDIPTYQGKGFASIEDLDGVFMADYKMVYDILDYVDNKLGAYATTANTYTKTQVNNNFAAKSEAEIVYSVSVTGDRNVAPSLNLDCGNGVWSLRNAYNGSNGDLKFLFDEQQRAQLTPAGDLTISGRLTQSSDETLKNILGYNVDMKVRDIANAPICYFTWKDRVSDRQIGTIAQYWRLITPECVVGEEGRMSMDYSTLGLVSSIVNAREITKHEDEIEALKKRVKELEDKLAAVSAA